MLHIGIFTVFTDRFQAAYVPTRTRSDVHVALRADLLLILHTVVLV